MRIIGLACSLHENYPAVLVTVSNQKLHAGKNYLIKAVLPQLQAFIRQIAGQIALADKRKEMRI
jgi:sulfate adenylyltransferase subunit 1 (EFTu-like GTPase family)